MTRFKPTQKPHANHDVIVKLKHVGPVIAARWTGRQWQLTNGSTLQTESIECWWEIPAEDHLDRLYQMEKTLARIAKWFDEFPATGKFADDGHEYSFGFCYGSNGERDFMRRLATEALGRDWEGWIAP